MGKSVPTTTMDAPQPKMMPTMPRPAFETDAARQETPVNLEKHQELNS
jgi:hypothetical protein